MTMTNDALFVDVLAHIEHKPETWDQNYWSRTVDDDEKPLACGTAHCFAGWAIAIAEGVDLTSNSDSEVLPWAHQLLGMSGDPWDNYFEEEQGRHLFRESNTLDDLYEISAEQMGVAVEVLRDKVQDRVRELSQEIQTLPADRRLS